MEDKAESWHTCLGHCPLERYVFDLDGIRHLVVLTT